MRLHSPAITGSLNVSGSITSTGNVSGSVSSTGSFGTLVADSEYGSLLIGTKTRQSGFNNQLLIESPSPGILLKDDTGGNQATQFYTIYSSNGIINHYFDHEKSIEFAHTTDIIGNNENIMLKIDANNVEFPYANTKISGSVSSTGSFGDGRFVNRLSVGTQESPSAYDTGGDTLLVSEPSSHAGITIRSSTSATGNIHFADGTSGNAAYRGVLQYNHVEEAMKFFTAGSSKMALDSSGILKDMAGVSGSISSTGSFGKVSIGGTGFGLAFGEDPDTGIRYGGTNTLEIHTGGSKAIEFNGSQVAFFSKTIEVLGQNITHGASRIKISQESTALSEFRFYGANTSTAGSLRFLGSSSDGSVGGTRMTIASSGNIGIGTTNPGQLLEVNGSGANLKVVSDDNVYLSLDSTQTNGDEWHIFNANSGATSTLQFKNVDQSKVVMLLNENGKIGINNVDPGEALDIVGNLKVQGDITAETLIISSSVTNLTTQFASGSTRFGDTQDDLHEFTGSLMVSGARIAFTNGKTGTFIGLRAGSGTGVQNVAIGDDALGSTTDGQQNTAVGNSAMSTGDAGNTNTGIGGQSLVDVTGNANTAVGFQSGFNLTSATGTVAIGQQAIGVGVTTGNYNTVVGFAAGYDLTSGANNVLIGVDAAENILTGDDNVIVGPDAGNSLTAINEAVIIGHDAGHTISDSTAIDGTVLIGSSAGAVLVNGARNTMIGYKAGVKIPGGGDNTLIGYEVGEEMTTAELNVAVGVRALGGDAGAALTGNSNVALGYYAFSKLQGTGTENVAVGKGAGLNATTTSGSIFLGQNAGRDLTTGNQNIAIGLNAMYDGVVTGDNNIAIGTHAGDALTSGNANVLIGKDAGGAIAAAERNLIIGHEAGTTTNGASRLIVLGYAAGQANMTTDATGTVLAGYGAGNAITSGIGNVAIGYQALLVEDDGDYNTAIGYQALTDQTGVSGQVANTAIGYKAGANVTTGKDNTFLGYLAAVDAQDVDGAVIIGSSAGGANMTSAADGTIAIGKSAGAAITSGQGNVAIGYQALDAEDDGDRNTAIGYQALTDQTGFSGEVHNTAVGYTAGANITTGTRNTIVGSESGDIGTTMSGSVFVGQGAGGTVSTGNNNIAIGHEAMHGGTVTGDNNIAIGADAGDALTSGAHNILIGKSAGGALLGVGNNVAIGQNALSLATSDADQNIAIGNGAMSGNFTSANVNFNIAIGTDSQAGVLTADAAGTVSIGYQALNALTSGNGNVAIGYQALTTNIDGDRNTAVGYGALASHEADTDGHGENTSLGYQAGGDVSSGTGNTLVGSRAGNQGTDDITTGDNNTLIGKEARASGAGGNNQTVIGASAVGVQDNSVQLGNSDVTHVYMGGGSQATVQSGGVHVQGTGNHTMFQVVNNTMAQNEEWNTGIDTSQSFTAIVGAIESDNTNGDTAIIACASGTISTVSTNQGYIVVNSSSVAANRFGFYSTSNTLRVKGTFANGVDVSIAIMSAT